MRGRAALLLLWMTACEFSSQQAQTTGASPPDASMNAPPPMPPPMPITCGQLTCDPHATCTMTTTATCLCNSGYTGNGMTCHDVDECASGTSGCTAACQNTPGSFTCYTPQRCSDIKSHVPGATDGNYTLYFTGNATKPWTAYCAQMAATPREYLSLTGTNSSQYAAGGASPGMDVTTTYTKVRFDPVASKIDISDRTFATSQGVLNHSGSGTMVTSMPFGVAMDCLGNNSLSGTALIDLTGTAFALTPGNAGFAMGGNKPGGNIQLTSGNQRATINGGGNCGWAAPAGVPTNPFNDNVTSGALLDVVYHP